MTKGYRAAVVAKLRLLAAWVAGHAQIGAGPQAAGTWVQGDKVADAAADRAGGGGSGRPRVSSRASVGLLCLEPDRQLLRCKRVRHPSTHPQQPTKPVHTPHVVHPADVVNIGLHFGRPRFSHACCYHVGLRRRPVGRCRCGHEGWARRLALTARNQGSRCAGRCVQQPSVQQVEQQVRAGRPQPQRQQAPCQQGHSPNSHGTAQLPSQLVMVTLVLGQNRSRCVSCRQEEARRGRGRPSGG